VSTFWVVAAALMLAVVAVLAVPLLRRGAAAPATDQDRSNVALFQDQLTELERDRSQGVLSQTQFEQARIELSQRLLADVDADPRLGPAQAPGRSGGAWRYAALACVPAAAVAAYLVLGTPQALEPAALAAADDAGEHREKLATVVQRLAARLEASPDDAQAWILLGRSLQLLGRAPEAAKAYGRALTLVPDTAGLHADYADVLVAAADGEWTPAATAAIAKALALDPSHPKTLWLAGAEAYARKDYRTALAHWEKLAPLAEPGSDVARIIGESIQEVKGLIAAGAAAGVPPAQAAKPLAGEPKPAAAGAVSGTVVLDPALLPEINPGDTVFVFARAASGPKMPLAIHRIEARELPYAFALDDSAAMAPGMTISAFAQVVIGARVSRSGQASPQPGDLEGYSAPVKPGANGVEVRIDARIK
jgi:cytochrome c-type biogenesis protein CcmH